MYRLPRKEETKLMAKIVPVKAANNWKDNSYLVEEIARLHFHRSMLTLDPTYGGGVWWKRWRPTMLFDHDLALDGHDFRDLPYDDELFDLIAFDPPYVSTGGRDTTKIKEFYARYGLSGAPTSPARLQILINDGLDEMARLVRRPTRKRKGGLIMVKCMDYVSSGKVWPGTFETFEHATTYCNLTLLDRFVHYGEPRMQPKRTRQDGKKVKQQHARNNYSMMFVFQAAAA